MILIVPLLKKAWISSAVPVGTSQSSPVCQVCFKVLSLFRVPSKLLLATLKSCKTLLSIQRCRSRPMRVKSLFPFGRWDGLSQNWTLRDPVEQVKFTGFPQKSAHGSFSACFVQMPPLNIEEEEGETYFHSFQKIKALKACCCSGSQL